MTTGQTSTRGKAASLLAATASAFSIAGSGPATASPTYAYQQTLQIPGNDA